jgi:hypothetical protein
VARDFGPRGVGQLLDDAIAVYRANWRAILTLVAIVLAPVAILYSITSTFYLRALFEWFGSIVTSATSGAAQPPEPDAAVGIIAIVVNAVSLLWWVAGVFFSATVYSSAGALLEGRLPAVREMLKAGAGAFFPLLAVGVAIYLILNTLGILTLGIGSAVAGVLLAFAGPIVVIEGGIGGAFSRSYALVKGHFWRVALLVAGAYLLSTQFEAALASPVVIREIIFGAQGNSVLTSQLAWGWKVFDGTLQGIAMAIVVPFLHISYVLAYLDLRARDEGMDLIVRARALSDAR